MKKNKSKELITATDADKITETDALSDDKPSGGSADKKMTLYEYEEKYVKRQNVKSAKFLVRLFLAVVGIIIFACLLWIATKAYDYNKYVGYGVGAGCLVLYVIIYVVPAVKLMKTDYFVTNVNSANAKEAKKHNRQVRRNIADKIIDFSSKVEGIGWYDDELVGKLAIARNVGDDNMLKNTLTELYSGKIKKTAKDIIVKSSVKAGLYSAISQSSKVDTLLVASIDLQLIKDLVFLYGFRPSDPKLLKIFSAVLRNSLIAYGLESVKIGNGVAKTLGDMAKGLPILGNAISVLVDSSIQGLVNGTLTAVIGYQTIRYLNKEYGLQNILDGIDVGESEEELGETCVMVEEELKNVAKKNKKLQKA